MPLQSYDSTSSSDTNDTAGWSASRIASGFALLVATLAQIIGAGVYDDGASQDAFGPNQLDMRVLDAAFAVPLAIGLEVAEITDMTLGV